MNRQYMALRWLPAPLVFHVYKPKLDHALCKVFLKNLPFFQMHQTCLIRIKTFLAARKCFMK